jgi:hypothetical protein
MYFQPPQVLTNNNIFRLTKDGLCSKGLLEMHGEGLLE